MTFKELIFALDFDDIWLVLDREYDLKDGGYEAYKSVFEQLRSIDSNPDKSSIKLVVAKVEDCNEAGNYIYDIFGIKEYDDNRYALELSSWGEWLSFNVLDKSIQLYGMVDVAAHALYEMTFYGYSAEDVDDAVKNEKKYLDELHDGIRNGTVKVVPFEKVKAEIGNGDILNTEEKAERSMEYERIAAENEKIYKMLLGS